MSDSGKKLEQVEKDLRQLIETVREIVTDTPIYSLRHQAHKWAGDLGQIRYEIETRLRATAT